MEVGNLEEVLMGLHCCLSLWFWGGAFVSSSTKELLRHRSQCECIELQYLAPLTTFPMCYQGGRLLKWKGWMLIIMAFVSIFIIQPLFPLHHKISFSEAHIASSWAGCRTLNSALPAFFVREISHAGLTDNPGAMALQPFAESLQSCRKSPAPRAEHCSMDPSV